MEEGRDIQYLFSKPIQSRLMNIDLLQFQEIRLRTARGLALRLKGDTWWLGKNGGLINEQKNCYILTQEDMRVFLDGCSGHSMYAFAKELQQGYITIRGGHRAGFAGTLICENGKIQGFHEIGSVNLRIAHEVKGCAERLIHCVFEGKRFCNTLIVSPPGCGKTTLLRDMIRILSDGSLYAPPLHVAVSDERGELGACKNGCPSFDLGCNTDVMDGGNKAENIWMMLRSLGPQVIAMDEIGGSEEAKGLLTAGYWGVGLLASIHGTVKMEPWRQMGLAFERYIEPEIINGIWHYKVYDQNGRRICENSRDFSDRGGDFYDRKRVGKTEAGMCI